MAAQKGIFSRVQSELESRDKSPGLSMGDILDLPDSLRNLVSWMIRQDQVELSEIATYLTQDEAQTRSMLAELIEKGYVLELDIRGKTYYRVRLVSKRKRDLPSSIWGALSDKIE